MQLAEMNIFLKEYGIIEWGELIKDILPKNYIEIDIKKDEDDENKRILTIILH